MTLAEKIILFRAEHNLTQEQFAEMCGICRENLIRIEKGGGTWKTTEMKILKVIREGEK